jgi:HEPN domain-containing protein
VDIRYELTMSWMARADHDYKIGWDEMQTDNPTADMVCYHAQQCVEKCLKAYLVVHETAFRTTHDIAELIEQCKEIDPQFGDLYDLHADRLTAYSIEAEVHDPADFYAPSVEEAQAALRTAQTARDFVRARLWKSRRYVALMDR